MRAVAWAVALVALAAAPAAAPAPRPWPISLDRLPQTVRDQVSDVVHRPTITARASTADFRGSAYFWLLDHPDRAALAWQRLGVPCLPITREADGSFSYSEPPGTKVTWRCLGASAAGRVWFAEGVAKPGPLSPSVPVKAVAVLRHSTRVEDRGREYISQSTEVYLQTESKFATTVMKIMGPAVPKMADQGAEQLLYFFASLAKYYDKHPEDLPSLLARD